MFLSRLKHFDLLLILVAVDEGIRGDAYPVEIPGLNPFSVNLFP